MSLNGAQKLSYAYDELCRLSARTLNTSAPFVTEYTYLEGASAGSTTTLVKTLKNGGDTLSYTYDALGNITGISQNGALWESYTYDSLNQLKTVTRGGDVWEYTYDNGGNLLSVTKNGTHEKTYAYADSEWKDLLTSYNGQTLSYDAIGNPLSYRDGMAFTWQNGRQLASVTQGENSYSYAYNADGLRTGKTVNGVTTDYYWSNGILQAQKTGDEYILFLYDENGAAYGLIVRNGTQEATYYYTFNLQGDIIGILDSSGNAVVNYTYNAWGELQSVTGSMAETLGQKNPLRYRGYYYDQETGFYLTGTRYYDPEIGRFINADGYVSTGQGILDNNMFAYCLNNPVIHEDSDGEMASAARILAYGAAAGGANVSNPVGWIILGATVVTAVAIWVIPWDSVGQSISNGWNRIKNSVRSASISRSISKAVSKAKTKIRNENRRYDYWIASYVDYGNGRGTYIPTTPLSYSRAISYVRGGGNVFADSRSNAYRLALAVGNGKSPTKPEIHRDRNGSTLGYWWHYHDGRRNGGHIFYV